MGYRLTKITTKTGDEGYTQLGDHRLSKDDLLIEALGTIDELNACIGLTLSFGSSNQEIMESLTQIQHHLFDFGGELHMPQYTKITPEKTAWLESILNKWNETLPPLQEFVLPRGTKSVAAAHIARTVCRRAERALVRLHRQVALPNKEMLRYLNRLSDLLFVASRMLAKESAEQEVLWRNE